VTCPAGTYSAKYLVLCPGAWTNSILQPFSLQLDLHIWQMTVAYFAADTTNYTYPLWYEFGPTPQQLFYGFPPSEYPDAIKVSLDSPTISTPTQANAPISPIRISYRASATFCSSGSMASRPPRRIPR